MTTRVFVYGDSHAEACFKNLPAPLVLHDRHGNSRTMHHVGHNKAVPRFERKEHDTANDVVCFLFGEVDCRCHVRKQIALGRQETEIIAELVRCYMATLASQCTGYKHVVVVGVMPPRSSPDQFQSWCLGKCTNVAIPFFGRDCDRVRYTRRMNSMLEEHCRRHGFVYFSPHSAYTDPTTGVLLPEFADGIHLQNNQPFLNAFQQLVASLVGKLDF